MSQVSPTRNGPTHATVDQPEGTTRYFDDPDRPLVATVGAAASLKCDTSGPLPIILVPQPSDDPNDPLVGTLATRWWRGTDNCVAELAVVAARCYHDRAFGHVVVRDVPWSDPRGEYVDPVPLFLDRIYEDCASHRLLPVGRRRCGRLGCSFGQDLGQEASLPARYRAADRVQRVGWSIAKLF